MDDDDDFDPYDGYDADDPCDHDDYEVDILTGRASCWRCRRCACVGRIWRW